MSWTTSDRVMSWRERHTRGDFVLEVVDGFRRHQLNRNAAVLAHYGFLSIFPLLMVATAVLGLVLRNNEELRVRIVNSAAAEIPVIGTQITQQTGSLSGSWWAIVIGFVVALWAASKAFTAVQYSYADIWEVPVDHRPNLAIVRLKALVGIVIVGGGVALSGFISSFGIPSYGLNPGDSLLIIGGVFVVFTFVLLVMMRLMSGTPVSTAMALPGAVFSGAGLTVLQLTGTWLVRRYLISAGDVAGAFATVFALIAWLHLQAYATLIGVEISSALHRTRHGVRAVDVVTIGMLGRLERRASTRSRHYTGDSSDNPGETVPDETGRP